MVLGKGNKISIHAPAKGATGRRLKIPYKCTISIHAPAKGATKEVTVGAKEPQFQSTLPRRERRLKGSAFWDGMDYFNPRSREGSDSVQACGCVKLRYFNPRSREGSDVPISTQRCPRRISIHAPAKGATILKHRLNRS